MKKEKKVKLDYSSYISQLNGEYKIAFDKIRLYSFAQNKGCNKADEQLTKLILEMLQAQSDEVPVETIVGSDIKLFCSTYFTKSTVKERIMEEFRSIYSLMFVFLLFFELPAIIDTCIEGQHITAATINLCGFILALLIGEVTLIVMNLITRATMFKVKWMTSRLYIFATIVLMLGLFGVYVMLNFTYTLSVPAIPAMIFSIGYIVIYKSIHTIYKKLIPADKADFPKDLNHAVVAGHPNSITDDLADILIARYYKTNKKRVCKGKSEISKNEYMQKLLKENRKLKVACLIASILFVVFIVIIIALVQFEDGIHNRIIFALFLILFEAPIVYFFFLRPFLGKDERSQLFKKMDELQMNLFEYVEYTKSAQTSKQVNTF